MRDTTSHLRVGLVIPLQGPGGLFAPSCEATASLAVSQINADGGICGREVTLQIIEGGDSPAAVAQRVAQALDEHRIDAVTGWHISAVREELASVVDGRVPYVYSSLYEGGEQRPGVICSGEVPKRQIEPALAWLRDLLGLRRWCIVGDDYIWPRASAAHTVRFCHDLGLDIVDEIFVPYGTTSFDQVVDRVARSGAEAVLMLLVGQDAVLFNREFAARSLHERITRFSPLMEETMLLASGADATENLYVAAGYFNSLATAGAMDLMSAYVGRYGPDAPPLNNMAESCHEGMLVLRALYEAAGSRSYADLVGSIDRVGYDGPRGPTSMEGGVCAHDVYLARADGHDFDVLERLGGRTR